MKGSRLARGNPADRVALIKSACMTVSAQWKDAPQRKRRRSRGERNSYFLFFPILTARFVLAGEAGLIFSKVHFLYAAGREVGGLNAV